MKRIPILAIIVLFASAANSQGTPYSWTYSANKISNNVYELHFHVDLNRPWPVSYTHLTLPTIYSV